MTSRKTLRHGRSLLLEAPERLRWHTDTLAPPAAGEVLVETVAGAVSIGSELPVYQGTTRQSMAAQYPRMTGYESLGVVREVGAGVDDLSPGDRVLAFYSHRTAALLPRERLIPVPPSTGDRLALLCILACDADKGVRTLAPQPEEPVLITGAGTMGLLSLWLLRARGVARVDLVEPRADRRELAIALGATHVWQPDDLPAELDYPVGLECSSRDAAFALLQSRMARAGRLCVLADGNREPLTLTPHFHERELRIFGSSDGWDYSTFARWYFLEASRRGNDLERLFQLEISAGELPATFARLASGEIAPVKILVRYP